MHVNKNTLAGVGERERASNKARTKQNNKITNKKNLLHVSTK